MANKTLSETLRGIFTPPADAVNEAGGAAYEFTPKHALAQYAATGCLTNTFYANASEQLSKVLELTAELDAGFLAKTAVYARENGQMKDMPALLVAVLSTRDKAVFERTFHRVIDNGKMLRNFVQIMRSGVTGRKSLGSLPKRMIREWFEKRPAETIFKQSVGQTPSIADVLKMVHPKPSDAEREALYGWFIGREIDADKLPDLVKHFERFKAGETAEVPPVPFQMLTALPLSVNDWSQIAAQASWQMTRMNLNTFERHGVLQSDESVRQIAARLRDREAIKRARVFPYQLLAAYAAANHNPAMPREITLALQDAMETATANVPKIRGRVYIFPDISGSMRSPVTGYRKGATSKVTCLDAAALIAAALLRQNPLAEVIPFSDEVVEAELNPRDSVMTNAAKLATLPSGGTNCSAPLALLNKLRRNGDLVIYVSDNESWIDNRRRGSVTATMREWNSFRSRNPQSKLVCIDLQPYAHSQAAERADILNIGGFSDQVFNLIANFAAGRMTANHWTGEIDKVRIDQLSG